MVTSPAINQASPVNWGHPLNFGLARLWMVMLGTSSGSRLTDLTNPGPSGNHGVLTNMNNADWVGSNRQGGFGALDFDDTDKSVLMGVADILDYSKDFSVAAGFTTTMQGGGGSRGQIVGQGGDGVVPTFRIAINGGSIWTAFADDAARVINTSSDSSFNDGNPHQVRVNFKPGGTTEIFVDGRSIETLDTSAQTGTHDGGDPLSVGRLVRTSLSDVQEFDGQIEYISMSSRAFSDSEVLLHYQLTLQGWTGVLNRIPRRFVAAAAPATVPRLTLLGVG